MRNGLAALALIAGFAAFAAPANAAPRCKPGHDLLARSRGHVVIWATLTRHNHRVRDRVYVCVSGHGGAHVVDTEKANVHPKVTHLRVAGQFVGFYLVTQEPSSEGPVESSATDINLYVFDAVRKRVDLTDLVNCQASNCSFEPVMTKYLLASSGWVAELYQVTDTAPSAPPKLLELVATYAPAATGNARQSVPLDFGSTISGAALSGQTVSWRSDLSGAASAPLSPSLLPSSTPQAISACQLLTQTDVSPVLGPTTSTGSPTQCQYSSESNPSKTLTLSFKAGLSSQQVNADARALGNTSGFYPFMMYPGYSTYVGSVTISGLPHEQLGFFAPSSGAEVKLDLGEPSGSADEQLAWLADVAFDRLFAIPVQRTN